LLYILQYTATRYNTPVSSLVFVLRSVIRDLCGTCVFVISHDDLLFFVVTALYWYHHSFLQLLTWSTISTTFDLDGSCRLMADSERLEKLGQALRQIRPGRRVLMPLEAMDDTELDIVA
jgi:G:T-mismatch repair DNA endonuclease (very short patch repair protein)